MWILLPHRSAVIGQSVYVQVRDDLPLREFAHGMPNLRVTSEDPSAWDRWVNDLLSRALVSPALTPAQVDRLPRQDRASIGDFLLRAWGMPGRTGGPPTIRESHAQDFLSLVRRLAMVTHRLPTEILQLSAREFWENCSILFGGPDDDDDDGLMRPPDLEFYAAR